MTTNILLVIALVLTVINVLTDNTVILALTITAVFAYGAVVLAKRWRNR